MIRLAEARDLVEASLLCLQSKAVWGYDAEFLEACREELTLTATDLGPDLAVYETEGRLTGVVQLTYENGVADLEKMFVAPDNLRQGIGQALFKWAIARAKEAGCTEMTIEAEPRAMRFYQHLGAVPVGIRPSGSIPGRYIPQLRYGL